MKTKSKYPVPSNKIIRIIDEELGYDPKTGEFWWKVWRHGRHHKHPGSFSTGYLRITVAGKRFLAHRLAWYIFYRKWPEEMLDHVNGNSLDNRIENLREATPSLNAQNRIVHRKGQPVGVYQNRNGRWVAQVPKRYKNHIAKTSHVMGVYATMEEAGQAVLFYCTSKKRQDDPAFYDEDEE